MKRIVNIIETIENEVTSVISYIVENDSELEYITQRAHDKFCELIYNSCNVEPNDALNLIEDGAECNNYKCQIFWSYSN